MPADPTRTDPTTPRTAAELRDRMLADYDEWQRPWSTDTLAVALRSLMTLAFAESVAAIRTADLASAEAGGVSVEALCEWVHWDDDICSQKPEHRFHDLTRSGEWQHPYSPARATPAAERVDEVGGVMEPDNDGPTGIPARDALVLTLHRMDARLERIDRHTTPPPALARLLDAIEAQAIGEVEA